MDLKERRNKLRLTQNDVAVKAGISAQKVSDLEASRVGLSLDMANRLGPVLKCRGVELVAERLRDKATAVKSKQGGRGEIARQIANLEDLRDEAESDKEKSIIKAAISELRKVLDEDDGGKPDGETVEKSSSGSKSRRSKSGPRRRGRNADGSVETVQKSGEIRRRNSVSGHRRNRPNQ